MSIRILGFPLVLFAVTMLFVRTTAAQNPPAAGGSSDVNPSRAAVGGDLAVPTLKKVIKTEREWAKQLTQAQFFVTRMKATEPAFSGKYVNNHALGTYVCVCCGAPLFNSRAKFESGTGWPSFWTPYATERIQTAPDYHGPEPRVEVMCSRCDAHLGHVFNDGPPPTGLRFCINSVSLKFVPDSKGKASAGVAAKSKAKSAASLRGGNGTGAGSAEESASPSDPVPASPPADPAAAAATPESAPSTKPAP